MRQFVWAEHDYTRCGVGTGDSFVRQVSYGTRTIYRTLRGPVRGLLPIAECPNDFGAAEAVGRNAATTALTNGAVQMKIERNFTKAGSDAYAEVAFKSATSEIRNPDGTIVFKLDNCEIPESWSQVASDVIAQKYFRKAGVPS